MSMKCMGISGYVVITPKRPMPRTFRHRKIVKAKTYPTTSESLLSELKKIKNKCNYACFRKKSQKSGKKECEM